MITGALVVALVALIFALIRIWVLRDEIEWERVLEWEARRYPFMNKIDRTRSLTWRTLYYSLCENEDRRSASYRNVLDNQRKSHDEFMASYTAMRKSDSKKWQDILDKRDEIINRWKEFVDEITNHWRKVVAEQDVKIKKKDKFIEKLEMLITHQGDTIDWYRREIDSYGEEWKKGSNPLF